MIAVNYLSNVALIILNYNSSGLTIKATEHLLSFESDINIIIVDNKSTDNSKQLLLEAFEDIDNVHLVWSDTNLGYAHGNNIGIDYAVKRGTIEFIGILNPDIIVDIPTIELLVETLKSDDKLGLITTETYFNGEYLVPNQCAWRLPTFGILLNFCTLFGYVHYHFLTKVGIEFNSQGFYGDEHYAGKRIAFVDVVQGCFFITKLQTLCEVGNLDSNTFLYFEENILGVKMRNIGKKNAVLTNHYVHHNHKMKDMSLIKRGNKIFDMTCMHNSRSYFIRNYFQANYILKQLLLMFLELDYHLRKMVVSLTFNK